MVIQEFGNEEAIVVKLVSNEEKKGNFKLKKIIKVLDEVSYIDEAKLKLAKYISKMYFCNVYDALKLMLPPGTNRIKSNKVIDLKKEQAVRVIQSQTKIEQDIENGKITSGKHIRLLKFLLENELVLLSDITEGLDISRAIVNTVIKNGYIELYKFEVEEDLLEKYSVEKSSAKVPTTEQKYAIDKIGSYIYDEKYKQCLLFGVTGSGKTEVYLQLIEKVLNQGKKAIVLVPEISLTYQTVNRFVSRFGENIAVLHSKMSVTSRKEEFKKIKEGKIDIVIGARSAIFSPLNDIGLVIIDEEHDSSYYSQTTPKYSTKEVAAYICMQNDAVLLLGTATPEIITYYKAVSTDVVNGIECIRLKSRPKDALLPNIEIVDKKQDRLLGNSGVFSNRLKEEIKINLKNKEQTMIFLNKRGYTSYFLCSECSYLFKCPNCDIAMTYHKNNNLLLCHYCSHVEKNVMTCPKCQGDKISQKTVGTQMIEEELKFIFPGISVLRMDADTTVLKNAHQKILDEFRNDKIDVLVGTQMISKGHDFANVTLVSVLGVDSMLAINDYTATEKAFSNISQVARPCRERKFTW